MRPDVKKERRAGWAVLGAVGVLGLSAIGWYVDDGSLEDRLQAARTEHAKLQGPELLSERIAKQERANVQLGENIEQLKGGVGIKVADFFLLKKDDTGSSTQRGTVFKNRHAAVHDEFVNHPRQRSIVYDEDLGFSKEKAVPPGSDVPNLLIRLQLSRKATQIAFSTPTPLKSYDIQHGAPVLAGPAGRPLMREWPLVMKVTASHSDVMWIIHRLSVTDTNPEDTRDPGGYPLVLQSLVIDSGVSKDVTKASEVISQVTATIKLAGLQFLTAEERAGGVAAPRTGPARALPPPPRMGGGAAAPASSGSTKARP